MSSCTDAQRRKKIQIEDRVRAIARSKLLQRREQIKRIDAANQIENGRIDRGVGEIGTGNYLEEEENW